MKLQLGQIEWRQEYTIGNLEIDNDHRQLFLCVNQYATAVKYGCGKNIAEKMLKAAESYATTHFEREEQLMLAVNYHHYEIHRQCHNDFTSAIRDFQSARFLNVDISEEIAHYMVSWLKLHVIEIDAKLGEYLLGQQQRLSACA